MWLPHRAQHGTSLLGVARLGPANAGEEERKERLPQARRVYIRQADLNAHGYIKNCPKSQSIIVYGPSTHPSTPHSEECKQRSMTEWAKTEPGQARLQRARTRSDKYIAEEIRENVKAPAAAQGGIAASAPQARDAQRQEPALPPRIRSIHPGRYPSDVCTASDHDHDYDT